MAREIAVHCASGKEEAFELEFTRQLLRWLPCGGEQDEFGEGGCQNTHTLLNNAEMVLDAIPGTEVLAFLSIKPVKCSRASSSGCEREDLCV